MHQQVTDKLNNYVSHRVKIQCSGNKNYALLAGICENRNADNLILTVRSGSKRYEMAADDCLTLMRPLTSLTKPITVEGYNDGNPFVPIEEIRSLTNYAHFKIIDRHIYDWEEASILIPVWTFNLLIRWHFWLWDQQLFATGDIIEIKD